MSREKGVRYALIGKRLTYSYSKRIHERLTAAGEPFRRGTYDLIEMPALSFPAGYRGFNLTNPFKERCGAERAAAAAGFAETADLSARFGSGIASEIPSDFGMGKAPKIHSGFGSDAASKIAAGTAEATGVSKKTPVFRHLEIAAEVLRRRGLVFDARRDGVSCKDGFFVCHAEVASCAVNTALIDAGRISFYNTDVFGFCYSFSEFLKQVSEVWIFGRGSTSQMVRILARHLGLSVRVFGREGFPKSGSDGASDSCEVSERRNPCAPSETPESDRASNAPDAPPEPSLDAPSNAPPKVSSDVPPKVSRLLVNCTPVGTVGYDAELSSVGIGIEEIRHFDCVADLTYHPEETELTALARRAGVPAKSGLEMLVAQAVMAQMIWNESALISALPSGVGSSFGACENPHIDPEAGKNRVPNGEHCMPNGELAALTDRIIQETLRDLRCSAI